MVKTFGVDLTKAFGFGGANSQIALPAVTRPKRRGSKVARPGLAPSVRGLPWSKMLRCFREKSS